MGRTQRLLALCRVHLSDQSIRLPFNYPDPPPNIPMSIMYDSPEINKIAGKFDGYSWRDGAAYKPLHVQRKGLKK